MIAAIFIQILLLGLLFFGVYKLFSRAGQKSSGDFSIRRLFHYSLLFFAVVISGIGISGLLGRTLDFGKVIAESRTDLARNLSFAIVGLPLLYFLARWSIRNQGRDPAEWRSFAWHAYLAIASITSLSIALFGLHDTLSWLIGNDSYSGSAISQLVIWSSTWLFHLRLSRNIGDGVRPHYLIGSGIGLTILAVGIGGLIGSVMETLINSNQEIVTLQRTDPVINNVITILIGLPVWIVYWLRGVLAMTRDFLWHAYVFLVGIAASFITTVIASSVVLYDLLVWFFGKTSDQSAQVHFYGTANAVGAAVIGLAIWFYHLSLQVEGAARSELRRIYEYIISGVSLIAASLGLLMIIVAVIESLTPSDIASGSESGNTLILAITLLIVGAPIWWYFWTRIEKEVLRAKEDQASPTRRIFLLMLFGVSGIAAVISSMTGIFLLLDDLLNGEFELATLRDARFAIGILITNGAIAGYHWAIYKSEREIPVEIFRRGRNITLVGPADEHIIQLLKEHIGGHIQLWISPDSGRPWNLHELIDLIDASEESELLIINEKRKLRVIPIHH